MNAFTIKNIESLSGVKAHTIRIWEQRYNFLKPQRTDTNIRYYSNNELKIILNIALLNKYGYKISHINKMTADEINEQLISLSHQEAQQELTVNQLIGFMIDLNLEAFEASLDNQVQANGIERVVTQTVFPFLEKIGILWLTESINTAQEHLVTNLVRQKILVAIEKCSSEFTSNKTALLFLPEGQFHELGLLYVSYLLKHFGVKVLYLGADVPVADLNFIVKAKNPDYIYTHLTALSGNHGIERLIRVIHAVITNTPVIISGPITSTYKKPLPANFYFKKSIDEVKDFIVG